MNLLELNKIRRYYFEIIVDECYDNLKDFYKKITKRQMKKEWMGLAESKQWNNKKFDLLPYGLGNKIFRFKYIFY